MIGSVDAEGFLILARNRKQRFLVKVALRRDNEHHDHDKPAV